MDANRHTYKVYHQDFTIDRHLTLTRELGRGAYGIVCSASCPNSPGVAIKKITNIFSKEILRRRALREIKMLIHFRGHKNITCLYDLDIVRPDFNEVYLYEDLMECDLHVIIRSGQPLTDHHYQSFIYQILCGLKYIHSAKVLHRDLKPGNLLVNADCELKICDFGLARGQVSQEGDALTEYVATRWYRAPEIMLNASAYSKAIDVWSVGCILAELLGGKPFFKGENPFDQINQIINVMGTPAVDTLSTVSPKIQEYLASISYRAPVPLDSIFPSANPDALDLLAKLLEFNPVNRISVVEALEHPYLRVWHDPNDEPDCPSEFDFSFESISDPEEMRQTILDTVNQFRAVVRDDPNSITLSNPAVAPTMEQEEPYFEYDQDATPTVPRPW